MKRIVSIQDISCLGRCSLTVALPVISALGVECAIVPTAVLSTHSIFPNYTCKDLSDQIQPIADHWQSQSIRFDAIYTGYLASPRQVDEVCRFFDRFGRDGALIFVDPAMADNGRLYPGFGPEFPAEMARVCARADVIVPNITEACLLTGTPYRTEYDEHYIRQLLQRLAELGPKRVALTGVSLQPGRVGVMAYDAAADRWFSYDTQRIRSNFHGTGDLFAAACAGSLVQGAPLPEALKLAADFTCECIRLTQASGSNCWYGVEFERAIPYLLRRAGRL